MQEHVDNKYYLQKLPCLSQTHYIDILLQTSVITPNFEFN